MLYRPIPCRLPLHEQSRHAADRVPRVSFPCLVVVDLILSLCCLGSFFLSFYDCLSAVLSLLSSLHWILLIPFLLLFFPSLSSLFFLSQFFSLWVNVACVHVHACQRVCESAGLCGADRTRAADRGLWRPPAASDQRCLPATLERQLHCPSGLPVMPKIKRKKKKGKRVEQEEEFEKRQKRIQ
jgi:hypothetical protein